MTKPFNGTINLDVRTSTPDWAPYEQPKAPPGSPNIIFIVWDDTGYGALEPFGGPIEMPTSVIDRPMPGAGNTSAS